MAKKKLSVALTEAINLPGENVQTGTYTVVDTDYLVICNKVNVITVTLPVATGSHKLLKIKNIGAGDVTVDGNGGDHIDGVDTQTLNQWDAMELVDYAANNWIIT